MAKVAKTEFKVANIEPADMRTAAFTIEGTRPYVQLRFSEKAKNEILAKHMAGSTSKTEKVRKPKRPGDLYEEAMYGSTEGWRGIPCAAFRKAMVDACRLTGVPMTVAKLLVFIEPDGYDATDGEALVRIIKGEPRQRVDAVRNATGVADIRIRAHWDPGWQATVRITYDATFITLEKVATLLMRAGLQVGIGEGRPNSKKTCGRDWGRFQGIARKEKEEA